MQGTKACACARGDIVWPVSPTGRACPVRSTVRPWAWAWASAWSNHAGRNRPRIRPRPRPRGCGKLHRMFLLGAVTVWLVVLGIFLWLRRQQPTAPIGVATALTLFRGLLLGAIAGCIPL